MSTYKLQTPTFMILPSLNCNANCKYCFSDHQSKFMTYHVLDETITFITKVALETDASKINIMFHGGEPLLLPYEFYLYAFDQFDKLLPHLQVSYSLQSNLFNITDQLMTLFNKYRVNIGTSIDGPENICDTNRQNGYFKKTLKGVNVVRNSGQNVGAIATITQQTKNDIIEIAKYFRNDSINFSLHAAIKNINNNDDEYALKAQDYSDLLLELLPWYIKNRHYVKISTFDDFVTMIVNQSPSSCTFNNCFRMFLAIDPQGNITSCQRFAGNADYFLGNIFDQPSLTDLCQTPAAIRQLSRQQQVQDKCHDCSYLHLCNGGCYYNALSDHNIIDPLCDTYKTMFDHVNAKLRDEFSAPENLAMIDQTSDFTNNPFYKIGPYTSLSYKQHPSTTLNITREILSMYELGITSDANQAAQNLYEKKYCGDIKTTSLILDQKINKMLANLSYHNNLYLHITFACNLRCNHCYAVGDQNQFLSLPTIIKVITQALKENYRQIIITGGEPMLHPEFTQIISFIQQNKANKTKFVLRSNFTISKSLQEYQLIGRTFDQIVISLDGPKDQHDSIRGEGSYDLMINNIRTYQSIDNHLTKLSLSCCVSDNDQVLKEDVIAIKNSLNIEKLKFQKILPLGRARESSNCLTISDKYPLNNFTPAISCGIGQNLYIKPDGKCYPCYANSNNKTYMGNINIDDLTTILSSTIYQKMQKRTVDNIQPCKQCEYRYLCGGLCLAYSINSVKTCPKRRSYLDLVTEARDLMLRKDY